MDLRMAWGSLLVLAAGCSTQVGPGAANVQTASTLVTRTAQHELRIDQGQCTEHNPHTCTPDDGYGAPRALIVTLRPLPGTSAACSPISDLAAWEKSSPQGKARPLGVAYQRSQAGGCSVTACFSVGDASAASGPQELTLSWRLDGMPVELPQPLVLTRSVSGQWAMAFKAGALAYSMPSN